MRPYSRSATDYVKKWVVLSQPLAYARLTVFHSRMCVVCVCVCGWVGGYVYVCMCMCVCVCVYVYVCMCVGCVRTLATLVIFFY